MGQHVGIEGSSVVVMFGMRSAATMAAQPFTARAVRSGQRQWPQGSGQDRHGAQAARKIGVAIKIKVPVTEFVGVAVSTRISEEGVLTSAIELVHGDPELNYQVFEEVGNGNVVAEWQNWGKKLRLPLYIKAGDGSLLPYSQQVDGVALGIDAGAPQAAADVEPPPALPQPPQARRAICDA